MLKCRALDPHDRPKLHEEVNAIENAISMILTKGLEERRRRRGEESIGSDFFRETGGPSRQTRGRLARDTNFVLFQTLTRMFCTALFFWGVRTLSDIRMGGLRTLSDIRMGRLEGFACEGD